MRASLTAARLTGLLAALALLAGCGSQVKGSSVARASASPGEATCSQTILKTLSSVLGRVYHVGVRSEKTTSAQRIIESSLPLRRALEENNPVAVKQAAGELHSTGHISNLRISAAPTTGGTPHPGRGAGGRVLASFGGAALAPLHGILKSASGATIGSYVFSVWANRGFVAEATGVAQGAISLRQGERSLPGSFDLAPGPLPAEGTLTQSGVTYHYASLPGAAYPTGNPVRIYLLKTSASIDPLCGATSEDTVVNTLSGVARLIYQAEGGPRTLQQVRRIQSNGPLLRAVASGDAAATRSAIDVLLHQHVVRMRVSGSRGLLADVGGPYVLAPVSAPLRLGGRRIGKVVLSIQDDEGYLRLARRLVGLKVLMYMRGPGAESSKPTLVKNSLGPGVGGPESVPASGRYEYRGQTFRVFTLDAKAFPSGPLTIRVLIPIPYS